MKMSEPPAEVSVVSLPLADAERRRAVEVPDDVAVAGTVRREAAAPIAAGSARARAQTSAPLELYFATKTSKLPAVVSVVSSASPTPNVAVPAKNPVT